MKYIVFNDERPENFEINNIPYINKANVQISQSKQIVGGSFHDFIPNKYPPDIEFAKNHGVFNSKIFYHNYYKINDRKLTVLQSHVKRMIYVNVVVTQ